MQGLMVALGSTAVSFLLAGVLVLLYSRLFMTRTGNPHVTVLVMGDIGRSPRMQYHSLSLARHGCDVTIVGYPGAQPSAELQANRRICIRHVVPMEVPWLPFILRATIKVASLLWQLFVVLLLRSPPSCAMLVQNPPAIPLLLVRLASMLQGAVFIIDFHNFGYSLLALKLGSAHWLVKAHLAYEQFCGLVADDAFCVTHQMQTFLATAWRVTARTLHDRPAAIFRPTPLQAQHSLFQRLWQEDTLTTLSDWWPKNDNSLTLFTQVSDGECSKAPGRPHLVVSSTSWTPDEDFGQLIEALPAFNEYMMQAGARAVLIITGKGDLRQRFEEQVLAMSSCLHAVRVVTVWLSFADYARLLGSADLGLSLHTSSSGIDLPMKVVDMFGAGLPVCARSFAALPELVRHGENGFAFDSTEELAMSLAHALGAVPCSTLPVLKSAAGESKLNAWDENWDATAWPVFEAIMSTHNKKTA
mmetsp:Transcript_61631/g.115237  ORF Transcript_61631/g.115237 Transcript_61631/m.115237 type:complete len:472 (+) Transcript_61631:102-1517(+)